MADTTVVIQNSPTTVSLIAPVSSVIVSAVQGPAGVSGAFTPIIYVAGTNLSGGMGVILSNSTAIAANSTTLAHAGKLIGITTGSALTGDSAVIQTSGELEGFFGLTVNSKVYLQANGTITSTIPTTGFVQQVGIALTTTKVLINIQPSLILG